MLTSSSRLRRFHEDLQLAGLSIRTQEAYIRALRKLFEHLHKSPQQVSDEDLRGYFLHIKNDLKWSRSACTISICAIKFFVEKSLRRPWSSLQFVRPAPERKLPVILTFDEVCRALSAVRLPRFRVCLSVIYSCGLRLNEGLQLQIPDIDGARRMLHVRLGKGGRDIPSAAPPAPHCLA